MNEGAGQTYPPDGYCSGGSGGGKGSGSSSTIAMRRGGAPHRCGRRKRPFNSHALTLFLSFSYWRRDMCVNSIVSGLGDGRASKFVAGRVGGTRTTCLGEHHDTAARRARRPPLPARCRASAASTTPSCPSPLPPSFPSPDCHPTPLAYMPLSPTPPPPPGKSLFAAHDGLPRPDAAPPPPPAARPPPRRR